MRSLLLFSSLSPSCRALLSGFGVREVYFFLDGLCFSRFKRSVISLLAADSDLSAKRLGAKQWLRTFRILLLHYLLSPSPLSPAVLRKELNEVSAIHVYMMVGCGWLAVMSRHHTVITLKGINLIKAVLKEVERDYSTFYLGAEDHVAALPPPRRNTRRCKKVAFIGVTPAKIGKRSI